MELLAFVPLAFMIRSDYKERVIRIYPLLFFGILTVTGSVWRWGWEECVVRVVGGVGVLAFLTGGVLLYLLLKYRRRINKVYRDGGRGVFALSDPFFSIDRICLFFDYSLYTYFNDLDFRSV